MSQANNLTLDEFVQLDFLVNMAAFDAGIATWNEKVRYDAVRPFSAIEFIYGDKPVTAWGGPGVGTVSDLPASQWRPYLNTADHPEYPSGSACFCAAHGQAARRYTGTDLLGWQVPIPQGASVVEPGLTPAQDIVIGWNTWSEFESDCGESRINGGVHFRPSIGAAEQMCGPIGDLAFDFVASLLAGKRLTPIDPGPPPVGPGKGKGGKGGKGKAGGPNQGKGLGRGRG